MTWHEGQFLDIEQSDEINEDPFRCSWCRKPLEASRLTAQVPPESQLVEAVMRMRANGRELEDVLHYVRVTWERECH